MTPAGEIHIELTHRAGQVGSVKIASTRPEAAQALVGKTPEQLLSMLPLLFSLCGNAQAYAALLACRAALGLAAEPAADAARECLLRLETVREHAWRILLDWPALLGKPADKAAMVALLKLDRQFKACLFADGEAFRLDSRLQIDEPSFNGLSAELTDLIDHAIFAGGLDRFLAITDAAQLRDFVVGNTGLAAQLLNALYQRDWLALGASSVSCLPELEYAELHQHMQHADLSAFCRTPQWQGRCYEATPLSRQQAQPLIVELQSRYGTGLLVRFVAVLLEVTAVPKLVALPTRATGGGADGVGLAQVQAARGLLIHRLALRQSRVYDYRIVAPTEWNVHPDGVLAQGLKALQATDADDLRQQAEWLIQAVDPCVAYRVTLHKQ
ncbi:Hydrogenase maturation factor HoxV/HupK [Methylomonas albis]|uniref:Nickel-dependent hydrogenase large subunit n=1 Tax=Methylomonas albis TaxID=1854563 RepID=A0ABR9D733_9GAMM|nr:nickel-dependent hydrogenase large subunit [Methylomonas albis]MBD9358088.1 nickel-dependent hydrogenase large subunit [Methylomonas albis]CAD6881451.1 Hydrogenase maturation factor HoxV/HupK [Methylomonas albis]